MKTTFFLNKKPIGFRRLSQIPRKGDLIKVAGNLYEIVNLIWVYEESTSHHTPVDKLEIEVEKKIYES